MEAHVEAGALVEIHSLSRADLNGKQGWCVAWDAAKERWGVLVIGMESPIALRLANIRFALMPEPASIQPAATAARQAATLLTQARSNRPEAATLVEQAVQLLNTAENHDPGCVMMHQLRGDLAHMSRDFAGMSTHMRRAVASDRGSHEEKLARRMGLASALGEMGDFPGEEEQCRQVLRRAPGHIHARYALGCNLIQRGRHDDAMPELMMAIQLPNDDPLLDERMVQQVRGLARKSLMNSTRTRSQEAAAEGNHGRAVELLKTLLATPGIVRATAPRPPNLQKKKPIQKCTFPTVDRTLTCLREVNPISRFLCLGLGGWTKLRRRRLARWKRTQVRQLCRRSRLIQWPG